MGETSHHVFGIIPIPISVPPLDPSKRHNHRHLVSPTWKRFEYAFRPDYLVAQFDGRRRDCYVVRLHQTDDAHMEQKGQARVGTSVQFEYDRCFKSLAHGDASSWWNNHAALAADQPLRVAALENTSPRPDTGIFWRIGFDDAESSNQRTVHWCRDGIDTVLIGNCQFCLSRFSGLASCPG